MKKLLIVLMLLPVFAHAQVFTTEQQTTLDSLKQELIILLTQEIALLQDQIKQIIATQQTQQTQIQAITQPIQTITPVLGATSNPYVFTPIIQLGGSSESDRGHVYITMPDDARDITLSMNGEAGSWRIVAGKNDYTGFNQCQNQSVLERIQKAPCKPQTYTWTIAARSNGTDFSTTTGSFIGSDAWIVQ